ncbi:MAG: hypothetical protein ACO289_02075 [Prochlorococcaceae cyanobacterium]
MTKPDHLFVRHGSIRIEWQPKDGYFICWRPNVSVGGNTRRDVLRFARWPASTPTGQALRDWLNGLDLPEDVAAAPPVPVDDSTDTPALAPELVATGFGPECHDPADHDPTANTRTII